MALVRQVHADLVRAAGLDRHVEQGERLEGLRNAHQRDRAPAVVVIVGNGPDPALSVGGQELVQRHVDDLAVRRPGARHECRVGLDHRLVAAALAQLVLQRDQRRALLRDQQQPGGLLVEPVHQLQELRARPRLPQLLDHPGADAAAAMHRDSGRLVDRDQPIILEHDRELARRCRGRLAPVGDPHRRNAHLVAQRQPGVGAGAALVDPHLTGPDDAVDVRLGYALEQLDEEVVQALAFRRLVDPHAVHCRRGRGIGGPGFGPYNALHHVTAISI